MRIQAPDLSVGIHFSHEAIPNVSECSCPKTGINLGMGCGLRCPDGGPRTSAKDLCGICDWRDEQTAVAKSDVDLVPVHENVSQNHENLKHAGQGDVTHSLSSTAIRCAMYSGSGRTSLAIEVVLVRRESGSGSNSRT